MSKFDKIRERLKKFSSERRGGKGFVAKSPKRDNKSDSNKASNQKKAEDKASINVGLEPSDQKKAEDKASINVGVANRNTKQFIEDLKEAYKAGLYSGGTKAKAFMEKYNLKPGELAELRTGIDQGLGTNIKTGKNVLEEFAGIGGILRDRGTIKDFYESDDFIKSRAGEIFEPGMSRFDKLPVYENPEGIFQTAANMTYQYNPILRGFDLLAGGSSQGMRGLYYGREKLGLEGEELNNFAAAVANDRDLYNQMMATPEMQQYELNEFRAEANKNAMARMRGGDPDPISGEQGGGEGDDGSDDGTTDPGTDPDYTPPPQNYYTFFDPNLGRYRSGTYDEYLQYVTAKDGGIIQLDQGGNSDDIVANNKATKAEIADLIAAMQEVKDLKTDPSTKQEEVKPMLMSGISDKIDELLRDIKDDPTTVGSPEDAVRMAEEDQPAKGILNIELPSDLGPALREDLGLMGKIKDSGMSLLMEALRKSDISTGSANQFIEEALNNFVAAGIIPPNTSYDQLTDPFKDLVTREAAMIARQETVTGRYDDETNQIIPNMSPTDMDRMRQEMSMFKDPKGMKGLQLEEPIYKMQEGKPEDFEQINPVMRDSDTRIMNRTFNRSGDMYNVADGGIIGLKDGGMNDMMQADSLMFRDPSDEGQWEYNV